MGNKGTLQLLIWVATLFFVVMMFMPLVLQMAVLLGQSMDAGP